MTPTSLVVCNDEMEPMHEYLKEMESLWADLDIPLVCIHGKKDRIVPYEHVYFVQEKMAKTSTDFKLLSLDQGNHFILWTEVEFLIREIMALPVSDE